MNFIVYTTLTENILHFSFHLINSTFCVIYKPLSSWGFKYFPTRSENSGINIFLGTFGDLKLFIFKLF